MLGLSGSAGSQLIESRSAELREKILLRLEMSTMSLPHDAWAYMFAPGGRFVGSELERALASNSSLVKALSVALKLFPHSCMYAADDIRRTLECLRGCTLPLWLDWRRCDNCDAASCLAGAVRDGSTAPEGAGAKDAGREEDDGAKPIRVCWINLRSTRLGPQGLEALAELKLPHLTHLNLALNPLGPACGRPLIDLLERNRQVKLVLDEEHMRYFQRYVKNVFRSKLLAFGMGFHSRLGESSVVRMLGDVRGDRDDAKVYDVPLLRAIEAHLIRPVYRARIEVSKRDEIDVEVYSPVHSTFYVKIKRKAKLGKLFEAYCNHRRIGRDELRFLFNGDRLRESETPDELEMEDDDVIYAMLAQVGDIGIFGGHTGGCGVELLQDSKALHYASARDAERIIAALLPSGTPDMSGLVLADGAPVLDAGGRGALMAFMDKLRVAHDPRVDISNGAHDEQVDISAAELAALLGGAQQRRLASLYGSRVDRIAIRRVAAAGQSNVISFHTDTGSFKTMQVPLNEESEYDGGRLVYATSTGFLKPERLPGSYTIHHWYMPHGVTALRRGARYSLFMQTTCRLSYSSASASENGCISSS